MPNADRIGTKTPVLNSEEFETNLQSGSKSTFVYEGSRSEMVLQRATEIGKGAAYVKLSSRGDGVYQLVATYNYDATSGSNGSPNDPPQNVHDLEVSMDTVSAFNSPKLYASLMAAFGNTADSVAKALGHVENTITSYKNGVWSNTADPTTGEILVTAQQRAELNLQKLFPANAAAQALMLSLFRNVALMGVETLVQFNNTYRRSITAASPSQVQASRTGEGMIWTSAEISAYENLPAYWWFGLPTGLQWMKSPVNVNMVAGGKTRIDYHYIGFKQASGLFYTAYKSATLLP